MSDSTIIWIIVAVVAWCLLRPRPRHCGHLSLGNPSIGRYLGRSDPRSAQGWPAPAGSPPDPQIGLPDLSVI